MTSTTQLYFKHRFYKTWVLYLPGLTEENYKHCSYNTMTVVFASYLFCHLSFCPQAPWRSDNHPGLTAPPANWPSDGEIVFQDYGMRYRPGLNLVLKQLNCYITGEEKVINFVL